MKLLLGILLAIASLFVIIKAEKPAICRQPHSVDGNGVISCYASMKRWSYNSAANECVEFIFGGCGGNDNRFDSLEICERECKV